jgi:hypothetical protein
MTKHKTAMGRTVDMAAIVAKNEKVRAVGNMSVNARGDTIDANGNIIVPATQKVSDNYQKSVGNKSAQVQGTRPSRPLPESYAVPKSDLTKEEIEFEDTFTEDLEIEQIKAAETKGKTK